MPRAEPDIAVEPGCQDEFDPKALPVTVAIERIRAALTPLGDTEQVPVRAALNRVLAADLISRIDVPGGTNSAMDGFAVRAADIPSAGTRELAVLGTAWAGRPFEGEVVAGSAVRIMTGALLPRGADTIVIQERTEALGERVRIAAGTARGENVRAAGEDIARGATVLPRGRRLMPADIGLAASLGCGELEVVRPLRVAYFSTGDELRSIGEALAPGQIYDSNRYTLHGMLARLGVEAVDLGVVRDDAAATEQAFRAAAAQADAVITSGGVSVGAADHVTATLRKLGRVQFWKVAMKPGRPLAFGSVGKAWFFGLPGNPVSVMVTFYLFVRPALRALAGETAVDDPRFTVTCSSRLKKRPGRMEFQRGVLEQDAAGRLTVRKTGAQGSGILSSMQQGNCFIVLPIDSAGVEPGAAVEVLPFYGIV